MFSEVEKAILKTLAYSDIFDYPLTKEGLWEYLISSKIIERLLFEKALNRHSGERSDSRIRFWASQNDGNHRTFYFLKGRSAIVKTRITREKESKRKMRIAKRVSRILSRIPTVQLIAISGALAMNNSDNKDDIDFFVITSKTALWITRFLVLLILELLGVRRKRKGNKISDTICVNMIITEEGLSLSYVKKDLYTAHEVVQMRPLFDRNNTYQKFISENQWVRRYMPNAFCRGFIQIKTPNHADSVFSVLLRIVLRFSALEKITRAVQLFSINRHRTTEIITDTILAFHPYDYRKKILLEYKRRLQLLSLRT